MSFIVFIIIIIIIITVFNVFKLLIYLKYDMEKSEEEGNKCKKKFNKFDTSLVITKYYIIKIYFLSVIVVCLYAS